MEFLLRSYKDTNRVSLVSGGSAVNYGVWTRGHAADFDRWSDEVGDSRWSYKSLLQYFKKSEHWHHNTHISTDHGFLGPVCLSSGGRDYALREPIKEAFRYAGFMCNADMNNGSPNGLARLVENWHQGSRQHASICYQLSGVQVLTNTLVQRVVIQGDKATGIKLCDGRELTAAKEVIISCGAIRTPQILMLSGIGPKSELSKYDIQQVSELPVGKNLHDHGAISFFWKLRSPEKGLAVGSPTFNKAEYATGNPMDWIATAAAPDGDVEKASRLDGTTFKSGPRTGYEIAVMYAVVGPAEGASTDGSLITTGVCCLSSTSRGTVTLASEKASDIPIIDPRYFATEHDRAIIRAGIRRSLEVMESTPLKDFIAEELPPSGFQPISSASSDAELDSRVNATSGSWFHCTGTASMGKVVDTGCRVYGFKNLRVVDASIIPISITAHLQAPMYAIAESAADLIAQAVEMEAK